jgi:hypothetical protein
MIRKKFKIFEYLSNKWINIKKKSRFVMVLNFYFFFCLKKKIIITTSLSFFATCVRTAQKCQFSMKTRKLWKIYKIVSRVFQKILSKCLKGVYQFTQFSFCILNKCCLEPSWFEIEKSKCKISRKKMEIVSVIKFMVCADKEVAKMWFDRKNGCDNMSLQKCQTCVKVRMYFWCLYLIIQRLLRFLGRNL